MWKVWKYNNTDIYRLTENTEGALKNFKCWINIVSKYRGNYCEGLFFDIFRFLISKVPEHLEPKHKCFNDVLKCVFFNCHWWNLFRWDAGRFDAWNTQLRAQMCIWWWANICVHLIVRDICHRVKNLQCGWRASRDSRFMSQAELKGYKPKMWPWWRKYACCLVRACYLELKTCWIKHVGLSHRLAESLFPSYSSEQEAGEAEVERSRDATLRTESFTGQHWGSILGIVNTAFRFNRVSKITQRGKCNWLIAFTGGCQMVPVQWRRRTSHTQTWCIVSVSSICFRISLH